MIDGRKQVTVAAVIVAARRQVYPWCAEPNPYVLDALVGLCAGVAGVTEQPDLDKLRAILSGAHAPTADERDALELWALPWEE